MKKFTSLLLGALIASSAVVQVSAFSDVEEHEQVVGKVNVTSLSRSVDAEMIEKIENGISAYSVDKEGNKIPLDCNVTINEVGENLLLKNNDSKQYEMNISTDVRALKVESNSDNYNSGNVNCDANISMKWEDNFGMGNVLKSLYGSARMRSGTLESSRVSWGATHMRIDGSRKFGRNVTSFNVSPNFKSPTLHAHYSLDFDKDAFFETEICVSPSIWS